MTSFTQANRPLRITTALDPDSLLLVGLKGQEGVSELFRFQLDLLADAGTVIPFKRLVGHPALVTVTGRGGVRNIHGLISQLTQGDEGDEGLVHYRATLVPRLWLLTRRVQSRIFQLKSVADVLKAVLGELDVRFELTRVYVPRNYCVQYQESDFAFASRLMEEEGIAYFFRHTPAGHQLVLMDQGLNFPDLEPTTPLLYNPKSHRAPTDAPWLSRFAKTQTVGIGKYTVRDYHCEMPLVPLQASKKPPESVMLGESEHGLRGPDDLELCDYPGGYAHHSTGIDPMGMPFPVGLAGLFPAGEHAARVRMEAEACQCLTVQGASNAVQLVPGHNLRLDRHADGPGPYLVLHVEHVARVAGSQRSGQDLVLEYRNEFTGQPAAVPHRPAGRTPRPRIAGTQTAVVTGLIPLVEEPFLDPLGRVKVKFHWDREGLPTPLSSCWVRVAQVWAGKGWGAFFWPRVGHEVIVAFEEGNPDRPIIVGSVYNNVNRPPFLLPLEKTKCGIKSCSIGGIPLTDFNQVIFHDEKDDEHVEIHSHTQEMITSQAMKISNTPGPSLELCGHYELAPGSGMGGGASESWEFDVGSGSGGGLLGDLVSFTGAGLMFGGGPLSAYGKTFSGKTSFVLGNNLGVTFGGNRQTHILGGYDSKIVMDFESVIFSTFGLPKPGYAMGAVKALLGIDGDVGLAYGQKFSSVYGGPNISINRCYKKELHRELGNAAKDKYLFMDKLASVMCGLLGATVLASDIATMIVGGYMGLPGQAAPTKTWVELVPFALGSRLHALMNRFDILCVIGQAMYKEAWDAYSKALLAVEDAQVAVKWALRAAASPELQGKWAEWEESLKEVTAAEVKLKEAIANLKKASTNLKDLGRYAT